MNSNGKFKESIHIDRGTQFFNSKVNLNCVRTKNKFERYLEEQGIQYMPSKYKNPQTNRKLERRWYEYNKYRWRFKTLDE
ncbi:MAG: hypothetical protein KAQ92_02650 [Candidatus Aenigmarchaeota archaeon]|nr:hypothetical protein [Candidatus Aenigmarchaeota archaeon]